MNANEDKKYRHKHYSDIIKFLDKLKQNNVQRRRDLHDHIYGLSNRKIYIILIMVGWVSLDPLYMDDYGLDDDEWLNARIKLDDTSIAKAMYAYLQPKNIEWCNHLTKDFEDVEDNI